jgi:hypothetical protein
MRVGRTLSVRLSHDWRRGAAEFDEENLVSCAGLVPVMDLAEQTGLSNLLEVHVVFGVRADPIRGGQSGTETDLQHRGHGRGCRQHR